MLAEAKRQLILAAVARLPVHDRASLRGTFAALVRPAMRTDGGTDMLNTLLLEAAMIGEANPVEVAQRGHVVWQYGEWANRVEAALRKGHSDDAQMLIVSMPVALAEALGEPFLQYLGEALQDRHFEHFIDLVARERGEAWPGYTLTLDDVRAALYGN